jgi:beta-lactamase class A
VSAEDVLGELGLTGAGYAEPVSGGKGAGFNADRLVIPASVMKIQVALTIENLIAEGALAADAPRLLSSQHRTPGPVGVSLMQDDVSISLRDLVVAMLTISDNVATDELISVATLDEINRTTADLGLPQTRIVTDIQGMLDGIGRELGFSDYQSLIAHDSAAVGSPSESEIQSALVASSAMNPTRGNRTTAADTVALLQSIWTDRAGPRAACASVRQTMARQLTRHRIASGFAPPVTIAAKSGGLLGVVRNEAGVVTYPDGYAYAVAVFTRRDPGTTIDPAVIDAAIGKIARALVDELRNITART